MAGVTASRLFFLSLRLSAFSVVRVVLLCLSGIFSRLSSHSAARQQLRKRGRRPSTASDDTERDRSG